MVQVRCPAQLPAGVGETSCFLCTPGLGVKSWSPAQITQEEASSPCPDAVAVGPSQAHWSGVWQSLQGGCQVHPAPARGCWAAQRCLEPWAGTICAVWECQKGTWAEGLGCCSPWARRGAEGDGCLCFSPSFWTVPSVLSYLCLTWYLHWTDFTFVMLYLFAVFSLLWDPS